MDVALMFPSRFIKSAEFKGRDCTLTITGIKIEELATEGGGTKVKGVVSFVETPKLWVMNRTNSECLKGMWGRETDNWIGKQVTLFPAPYTDSFTGEQTTAIRVKGSPDLERDTTIEIHLPRKKSTRMKMIKTAPRGGARPVSTKTASSPPLAAPQPFTPPTSDEVRAAEQTQNEPPPHTDADQYEAGGL